MRKINFLGVSLLAMMSANAAIAQTAPTTASKPAPVNPAPVKEAASDEIIVTATKREQTLQNVPISVSVTGAQTIEKAQIRDLLDLQSVVPSLKVNQFQSSGQTNFSIRGFGNGNGNDGIESSVGIFIDGVYRSRSAAAIADLPDLERVEVLRGPQSTLFGKNVSAGAISIVTAKPRFSWGGEAEATIGNFGQTAGKAFITGPITETLAFKLSGSVDERNGYDTNIVTGGKTNNRNRWSVRGDVLWQPTSEFSLRVIADYNIIKEICCAATTLFNGPVTQVIGAPKAFGGLGLTIGDPNTVFNRNVIFNNRPDNRVLGRGVSAQADYDFSFAKFTSITAYRAQGNQAALDVDFTSADISDQLAANDIKTFTQEFRLASSGTGPLSWLIGAFYDHENLKTARQILYGKDTRAWVNALTGGPAGLVTGLEALQNATNPTIIPGATYFQAGQGINDAWSQKDNTYSAFGTADYKITDKLKVTVGASYLADRKAVISNVVLNDPFSSLNLQNVPGLGFIPTGTPSVAPFVGCLLQKGFVPGATLPVNLFGTSLGASLPGPGSAPCPASAAGTNPFALNALQFFYAGTANHGPVQLPNATEDGKLNGSRLTYSGRVAYDFGFVNAYGSYSTGWKAGAYNLSSDSVPASAGGVGRFALPEKVKVYEVGLKAKFPGGFANLAVFKQTIDNFQLNSFIGTGFALVNAGKESAKGFELEGAFTPFHGLALTGAVTYLDPKYDSFKQAPCLGSVAICQIADANGNKPLFFDRTGTKPAGVPKWSSSISATYTADLGTDYTGFIRGEYDYTSKTQLTETVPANLSSYANNLVNASAGIENTANKLAVQFWVRNLTQNNFLLGAFPTVVQSGSFSGYPNEPRTFGVTVRKKF